MLPSQTPTRTKSRRPRCTAIVERGKMAEKEQEEQMDVSRDTDEENEPAEEETDEEQQEVRCSILYFTVETPPFYVKYIFLKLLAGNPW
jgi:hypothetical protein